MEQVFDGGMPFLTPTKPTRIKEATLKYRNLFNSSWIPASVKKFLHPYHI